MDATSCHVYVPYDPYARLLLHLDFRKQVHRTWFYRGVAERQNVHLIPLIFFIIAKACQTRQEEHRKLKVQYRKMNRRRATATDA